MDLTRGLRTGSLKARSGLLWDREALPLYGKDLDWQPETVSARSLVLYQIEPRGLSPYHVGRQEIWLDAETLRLRKLVLVFRRRGDVGVASWRQFVCVFFNDRKHGVNALEGDTTEIRESVLLEPQQAAFVLEGSTR
jgi:hypothetical protein